MHHYLHLDNLPGRRRAHRLYPFYCSVYLGRWSPAALIIGSSPAFCDREFGYRPTILDIEVAATSTSTYQKGMIHGKHPTADGLHWVIFWNSSWRLASPLPVSFIRKLGAAVSESSLESDSPDSGYHSLIQAHRRIYLVVAFGNACLPSNSPFPSGLCLPSRGGGHSNVSRKLSHCRTNKFRKFNSASKIQWLTLFGFFFGKGFVQWGLFITHA